MEKLKNITFIFLLAVGLLGTVALAKSASVLLQEGLYAEEVEGDLDAAIKVYQKIIADPSANRSYVAQALYRQGMCYMKKKDEPKAREVFGKLVQQYGDQTSLVEKVKPLLADIMNHDPATLMPPDTLAYVELGNPGRQIETILQMLKGTPFENPLAAIPGPKGPVGPGGKSPADMMAALLNPSMMAEFKKIRGMAVGITNIQPNNPPSIAVLYPGKSDAFRGIILAMLGMVGTVGEPIEGMQTLTIKNGPGVAYDEEVIIIAQPLEQLNWCIKQYKGITNEPTLASQNKVFAKIGKENRQANAITVWVDGARTYSAVSEMLTQMGQAGQLRVADGIADFKNIEDIIITHSIEQVGIAIDANINFKDNHNCLPYKMIQTPNLSRTGFMGVPSEAVAVASFALGEAGSTSVETAQKAVQRLTGLSIGREIFANIEQVNLFAVPSQRTTNEGGTIGQIASCFGLALTSHNPQHTHQLLTQILEIANLVATVAGATQSVEQSDAAEGRYVLPLGPDQKISFYVGQRDKTTVLAFSPDVLKASLSAVKGKKSALTAGVLQEPLKQMAADTSKMVLVNVGGAMQVVDAYITMAYDNPQNPAHKTLAQLAQACGKTYVQWRTRESDNNFNFHYSINQLPPLDGVFPMLVQLSKADLTAKVKATKPKPSDGTIIGLKEDMKLNWKPGIEAKSHKVYFGTRADKLSLLAEVSKPDEVKLPALREDGRYYWRVDEVWSDGKTITGDVWSFSIGKLISWWKLDESKGSTADDSSGNGNKGTLQGDPVWLPNDGKIGGALEFDGQDDYVEIEKESSFDITGQITLSVWVKTDDAGNGENNPYVAKGDHSYAIKHYENNSIEFFIYDGGWHAVRFSVDSSFNDVWHHLAGTYDGRQLKLYIDSALKDTTDHVGSIATSDFAVNIGRNSEHTDRFYDGLIDDVRIYNYALGEDEIKNILK